MELFGYTFEIGGVAMVLDSYLFSPELRKYINNTLPATTSTVSTQDIDNLLMIQRVLPKLKIRLVRIVNGCWEALVTLKYPLDGSCTEWHKVRDLINEFKGGTR